MIISPKQLDALGDRFATEPVCVGPFEFVSRVGRRPDHAREVDRLLRAEQSAAETDRLQDHHRPGARAQNLRAGRHPGGRPHRPHRRRRRSARTGTYDPRRRRRSATRGSRSTSGTRTASASSTERRHAARRSAVPPHGVRARARPQAHQPASCSAARTCPDCYPIRRRARGTRQPRACPYATSREGGQRLVRRLRGRRRRSRSS